MSKFRFTVHVLGIATLTFVFASIAQAQATRTWVSGVGDDANPCSRIAPCKTWAGAISKTAPGGEIDALDPGGFGAVTITKSITLEGGEGQTAGVLVSGTNGIVVQAATSDVVTLRDLDINGIAGQGLNGVQILQAKAVHIDHCQIYGFSLNAINDNRTTSGTFANQLFVNDTFIRANSGGIAVSGSSTKATEAFIEHCRIQDNGGFGSSSGFGVSGSNGNVVNVLFCNVSRNTGEGVKIDTNAGAVVIGCTLNSNLTGALDNGVQFILADNTIINNGTGVSGSVITYGTNRVRGNGGGNTLPPITAQQ